MTELYTQVHIAVNVSKVLSLLTALIVSTSVSLFFPCLRAACPGVSDPEAIGRAKRPVFCLCLDFVGEVASEKRIVPQCVGELIQVGWSQ